MELWLVRHGQTVANEQKVFQGWSDLSLSNQGREEAQHVCNMLKNQRVDRIYASPLKRAMETADIIREGLLAPRFSIIQEDALKEINFGMWEGLSSAEIASLYPSEYQHWLKNWEEAVVPGGESAKLMYERVQQWTLELLKRESKDARILLVSHQGVILQMIAHLLSIGLQGSWHFQVQPGSLSVIEIYEDFAVLTKLNQK